MTNLPGRSVKPVGAGVREAGNFMDVIMNPTPRMVRVYFWTLGVTLLSTVAVCWPLITGSGEHIGPAKTFGGVEFLLAGIVIMFGGVTDLLCSNRSEHPRAQILVVLCSVLSSFLGLSFSARLAAIKGPPPGPYILFAVVVFIFTITCGTIAVWLGGEGG